MNPVRILLNKLVSLISECKTANSDLVMAEGLRHIKLSPRKKWPRNAHIPKGCAKKLSGHRQSPVRHHFAREAALMKAGPTSSQLPRKGPQHKGKTFNASCFEGSLQIFGEKRRKLGASARSKNFQVPNFQMTGNLGAGAPGF